MKYEDGKLIIDLYDDVCDELVVASLKDCYRKLDSSTWHPNDLTHNKKLKKALIRVIRHYSNQAEFDEWLNDFIKTE